MSESCPSSPCKDLWIAPGELFTKTVTTKGFGFYCPQDGSLCKVKVLKDESNLVKDVDDEQIKEIVVGDVDDPLERILEACVQSMKNDEIAIFKFPDPLQPRQISENPIASPETEIPPEKETSLPTDDKSTSESTEQAVSEDDVAKENVETDCTNDSNETALACNGENVTTPEAMETDNCSRDNDCVPTSPAKEISDIPPEIQSPDAELSDYVDCEPYDEKTPVMYEVTLQLLAYTREPEIWEMSITEKWRRANYHKQKGMLLYSQGSYEWAFRRFGLSLKYIISLEHDIPSGHSEEGMNIVELKLSCYLNLAACQMRHHNYSSVVNNCTKALEIQADNSKAMFRRGAAYIQIQEYEKAKEDLDKAQQLEPKNQAIIKQQQLLRARVQKLNQYYAKAMKKMFS